MANHSSPREREEAPHTINSAINGLFVSKKLVELARKNSQTDASLGPGGSDPQLLRSADTNEFIPSNFSVTEGTTKHLKSSGQK